MSLLLILALEYLRMGLLAVRPDGYDAHSSIARSSVKAFGALSSGMRPHSPDTQIATGHVLGEAVGVRPSGALSMQVNSSADRPLSDAHAASANWNVTEDGVGVVNESYLRPPRDKFSIAKVESLLERFNRGHHGKPADKKPSAASNAAASKANSTSGTQGVASVPSPIKFSDSIRYKHVLIFYGILYTIAFLLFLCYRYQQAFKVNVGRTMRQIAMFYWRHPRVAPIAASCALYLLADILGQLSGRQGDQGGACWKIALIPAAAIYNGIWHGWFYRTLDTISAERDDGVFGNMKRVILMLIAHLVLYLPLGVPLFLAVSDFFRRSFYDASSNCASSAVVSIPRDIGESTVVAANLVTTSYGWSAVFWQLSNLLNFTCVQMWSPPFKSTWDGIVIVLWNLYIIAAPGEPVGVGPLLADRDVLTQEPKKQAASTNCDHTSLYAIFVGIYAILYYILYMLWRAAYYIGEYTYYFFRWLMYECENGKLWTSRKTWEIWCVLCYIVRIVYMLARVLLSWGCTITWRILMFPLVILDKWKWYIGLFFLPRFWDYDKCPCPSELDASWSWTTISWNGSLLTSSR